jgi:hypothetical protein
LKEGERAADFQRRIYYFAIFVPDSGFSADLGAISFIRLLAAAAKKPLPLIADAP